MAGIGHHGADCANTHHPLTSPQHKFLTPPIHPAPHPSTPDAIAALITRALHVGAELTERLLDLPPDSPRNPAADYADINRAMRQAALLLQRLADPAEHRDARRIAARQHIIRAVEDAIHQHGRDRDPDALRAELLERLRDETLDADLDRRPTPDIVAGLCRDLGLVPYDDARRHKRRTPEDVAELRALAATLTPKPQPKLQPKPQPKPQPAPPAPPLPPHREPPTRRAPLSTPSLILPPGLEDFDRPESRSRDHR